VRFGALLLWLKRATGIGYRSEHLCREAEATERLRAEAETSREEVAKALGRLEENSRDRRYL
jgi:hypothetical protein